MTSDGTSVALRHRDVEEPAYVEGDDEPTGHDENFAGRGVKLKRKIARLRKAGTNGKTLGE
jgi:hypothetical protein